MISNELITFAKGNADFYTAYEDYHNHNREACLQY